MAKKMIRNVILSTRVRLLVALPTLMLLADACKKKK